jgi:3-(3-hydroxy-phenyl)propionate hydroxylase
MAAAGDPPGSFYAGASSPCLPRRGTVPTTPATTGDPAPVVIVGGGPTGIAAAILLAQHGLPVAVLERHLGVYPHPRAVHLDDEVHRILQQLGIGTAFAGISRPGAGLRVLDAHHRVLAEFRRPPTGPHGYPQANMFDQPDLERLLRDHLARNHPRVTLHQGVEVVAIDAGRPGVPPAVAFRRARRDAEPGDEVQRLTAVAVLGCDGAGSTTRGSIGGGWRDLRFEERWLVVDGRSPYPLSEWDGVDQVADPQRAATFMRVGTDRYRWEFRVHPGEDEDALRAPRRLERLLSPWIADVPPADLELLRCATYTFRARVADRWRRERVFLLGDAAHLTPPFIGQGLGAGLRDAANLAWKLARVLAGDAPEALLDSYEAERRRHAVQQIRLARTTGWALTGGGGAGAAVRRGALRAVFRVPGLAPKLLDRGSPPLRGSALTEGRRRVGARSLVGTLIPQPEVTDGDTSRPLDAVLGLGPAILGPAAPDADLLALATRIGAGVFTVDGHHGSASFADAGAIEDGGVLSQWLSDAGATAVVLRPDRVVLAVARSPKDPGRELAVAPACARLMRTGSRSPV